MSVCQMYYLANVHLPNVPEPVSMLPGTRRKQKNGLLSPWLSERLKLYNKEIVSQESLYENVFLSKILFVFISAKTAKKCPCVSGKMKLSVWKVCGNSRDLYTETISI